MSSTSTPIIPLWISGKAVDVTTNTITVHNSRQQKVVHTAASASVEDAKAAMDAAAAAFPKWKKSTYEERRAMFNKAALLVQERSEELIQAQMDETSCPVEWATFNIHITTKCLEGIGGRIASACEGLMPVATNATVMSYKQPVGVVLEIAPWNAALYLCVRSLVNPLAAGCTVVLKASELSPKTHHLIAKLFADAGLPMGVLNVVQCRREDAGPVTEALIAHPACRKIEFTGSNAVGSRIAEISGRYLKPTIIELGGKGASIVLEDADLTLAAQNSIQGAYIHHGQVCFSVERIIVLRSIYDKFLPILLQTAKSMGPHLANIACHAGIAQRGISLLKDAQAKGAKLLFGEIGYAEGTSETGLKPTLLTGVTEEMEIFDEESFAPTASVYVVDSEKEAVEVANNTKYGLISSVFGKDQRRIMKVARALDVGTVTINGPFGGFMETVPLSVVKGSGYGRNGGSWGIEEFLYFHTIVDNTPVEEL